MQRLVFKVQGSQAIPYVVTATGEGDGFQIHCTCPASRRAAKMCKHAAALLVGDVTHLVEPSASVIDLARLAAGSRYVDSALDHNPAPVRPKLDAPVSSLEDVAAYVEGIVRGKDLHMAIEPYGEGRCVAIYTRFKNGGLRKRPTLIMAHQLEIWDEVMMPDGSFERANFRARVKPWSVIVGSGTRAWADIQGAAMAFVTALNEVG